MHPALFCLLLSASGGRLEAMPRTASVSNHQISLAWYTSMHPWIARELAAKFTRQHPSVKVELRRPYLLFEPGNRGEDHWERADVVTEVGLNMRSEYFRRGRFARLNLQAADLGALCPWVLDPRGSYAFTSAVPSPMSFERPSIPDRDATDSLAELVQPRWKGKIALLAPTGSPQSDCFYRFIVAHPALGLPWLEKMRDNDVMLLQTPVLPGNAIRPVGLGGAGTSSTRSRRYAWLHIMRQSREIPEFLLYATAINRRAPHPSAAQSFVKWLLDQRTQEYMDRRAMSHSLLKGSCERFEDGPVCGRGPEATPTETKKLRRDVWNALLGTD